MLCSCDQCGQEVECVTLAGGRCPLCRGHSADEISKMESESSSEKLAIGAYKVLGIMSFIYAFAMIQLGSGEGFGFVLLIMIYTSIILILALILGPGLSLFISHNRHLNFIKVLSLVVVILMVLFQDFDWIMILLFIAYGIACISFGTDRYTSFLNRIGWANE